MFKLKINPLWNTSVIFITFFFLIILSSYVLNNPNESANTLKSIYDFFAINFDVLPTVNKGISRFFENSANNLIEFEDVVKIA